MVAIARDFAVVDHGPTSPYEGARCNLFKVENEYAARLAA
jgi:hypothetical protein